MPDENVATSKPDKEKVQAAIESLQMKGLPISLQAVAAEIDVCCDDIQSDSAIMELFAALESSGAMKHVGAARTDDKTPVTPSAGIELPDVVPEDERDFTPSKEPSGPESSSRPTEPDSFEHSADAIVESDEPHSAVDSSESAVSESEMSPCGAEPGSADSEREPEEEGSDQQDQASHHEVSPSQWPDGGYEDSEAPVRSPSDMSSDELPGAAADPASPEPDPAGSAVDQSIQDRDDSQEAPTSSGLEQPQCTGEPSDWQPVPADLPGEQPRSSSTENDSTSAGFRALTTGEMDQYRQILSALPAGDSTDSEHDQTPEPSQQATAETDQSENLPGHGWDQSAYLDLKSDRDKLFAEVTDWKNQAQELARRLFDMRSLNESFETMKAQMEQLYLQITSLQSENQALTEQTEALQNANQLIALSVQDAWKQGYEQARLEAQALYAAYLEQPSAGAEASAEAADIPDGTISETVDYDHEAARAGQEPVPYASSVDAAGYQAGAVAGATEDATTDDSQFPEAFDPLYEITRLLNEGAAAETESAVAPEAVHDSDTPDLPDVDSAAVMYPNDSPHGLGRTSSPAGPGAVYNRHSGQGFAAGQTPPPPPPRSDTAPPPTFSPYPQEKDSPGGFTGFDQAEQQAVPPPEIQIPDYMSPELFDSPDDSADESADQQHESGQAYTADELRNILHKRQRKEEPAADHKTKFVGSSRPTQEQQAVVLPRIVPPNIRKACQLLGLAPEELTGKQKVLDAWKRHMTKVHPDTGGDPQMAIMLNQAKDALIQYLSDQEPKLGKALFKKDAKEETSTGETKRKKTQT